MSHGHRICTLDPDDGTVFEEQERNWYHSQSKEPKERSCPANAENFIHWRQALVFSDLLAHYFRLTAGRLTLHSEEGEDCTQSVSHDTICRHC